VIHTSGVEEPCETYNASQPCVAPTVLRFLIAIGPSPYGLGYVLSRLRRSGFVVVDLESSRDDPCLGVGISWLAVSNQ
jgi:hypothetical protein